MTTTLSACVTDLASARVICRGVEDELRDHGLTRIQWLKQSLNRARALAEAQAKQCGAGWRDEDWWACARGCQVTIDCALAIHQGRDVEAQIFAQVAAAEFGAVWESLAKECVS